MNNRIDYLIKKDYDYMFLKNKIKKMKNNDIDSIAVGISYSLTGIDENKIKSKFMNLSLSSQDIYYSYKIARNVITYNKAIKNCFIGISYYSLNFDLSKTKNESYRIENVYYPMFKDYHNYNKQESIKKNIKSKLVSLFSRSILRCYTNFNGSYYNNFITRENQSGLKYNLDKYTYEEKSLIGKKRAEAHNKMIKYSDTMYENKKHLSQFINYLNENNINPVILIFPVTDYYKKYIYKDFKNLFYEFINDIKEHSKFEIIDLYNADIFKEEDFIDIDHLNSRGADKVSTIINKYLDSLQGE